MAFKSFSPKTSESSSDLPWVNEFVASNPDQVDTVHDVRYIRTTPKGIMLGTDSFMAFLFKSVAMHGYLLEFCIAWQGKEKKCPRVQLQLTSNKPYFLVGCDDQQTGVLSKQEYGWYQACRVELTSSQNPPTNPLPLPRVPNPDKDGNGSAAIEDEMLDDLPPQAPARRSKAKDKEKTHTEG